MASFVYFLQKSTHSLILIFISIFIISSEICITNEELINTPSTNRFHYFRRLYDRNCTHLIGNLVLTDLDDKNSGDLSFLHDLKEIYGYVYFRNITNVELNLRKLRMIRGRNGGIPTNFTASASLYIHENNKMKLFMPVLSTISAGDVVLFANNQSCFIESFNWNKILYNPYKQKIFQIGNNFVDCDWKCDNSCPNACWNKGFPGCHLMTNNICPTEKFDGKYCYRENELQDYQSCHPECIGGCFGTQSSECHSCLNFNNNGNCTVDCVPSNKSSLSKYKLANFCVEQCPVGMLIQEDRCVLECDLTRFQPIKGICVPCKEECPKVCRLSERENDVLDGTGLASLQNCTILEGNLIIESASFDETFTPEDRSPIRASSEFFALSNLRVITGYVIINLANFKPIDFELKNMSFLWKLSEIQGVSPFGTAMEIKNTKLFYLGTSSLRTMKNGVLGLENNPFICYVQTLPWFRVDEKAKKNPNIDRLQIRGELNIYQRNGLSLKECEQIGDICHQTCNTNAGCWGPDSFDCVLCENEYANEDVGCVTSCSDVPGYRSVPRKSYKERKKTIPQSYEICEACHPECLSKCTGPSVYECLGGCKNAMDNGKCVPACPNDKYLDSNLKECFPCHKSCQEPIDISEPKCSGPSSNLGFDGCSYCSLYQLLDVGGFDCVKECPSGMYKTTLTKANENQVYWDNLKETKAENASYISICSHCDEPCTTCNAPGVNLINGVGCLQCDGLWHRNKCVKTCPEDETYTMLQTSPNDLISSQYLSSFSRFPQMDSSSQDNSMQPQIRIRSILDKCLSCHEECLSKCWGHQSSQCFRCRHFTLAIYNAESSIFELNCVSKCPNNKPYVFSGNDGVYYCYEYDQFLGTFINETSANQSQELLTYLKSMLPPAAFQEQQSQIRLSQASSIGLISVASIASLILLITMFIVCCLRLRLRRIRKIGKVPYTVADLLRALCCGKTLYRFYESPKEVYTNNLDMRLASPNKSQLHIIMGSELETERLLGSGSFGDVFYGRLKYATGLVPLEVAIKVLNRDKDSKQIEEMIAEASLMATVNNRYCLSLLGICLANDSPKLISEFLALGSLDSYLDNYKDSINQEYLLEWCQQIAEGMQYLGSVNIIHRDLACRNILLRNEKTIAITDFGLSRMIRKDNIITEYGEHYEILVSSGKVPIRWLAVESLRYSKYSVKTDVWAYGVTVWEIFSFGERPYSNFKTSEIVLFVLEGGRLQIPPICRLALYKIFSKCWQDDPEKRPTFESLAKEFADCKENLSAYLNPYPIRKSSSADDSFSQIDSALNNSIAPKRIETNKATPLDEFDESQHLADDSIQPVLSSTTSAVCNDIDYPGQQLSGVKDSKRDVNFLLERHEYVQEKTFFMFDNAN